MSTTGLEVKKGELGSASREGKVLVAKIAGYNVVE